MHVLFRESHDNLLEPYLRRAARTPITDDWRGWNYDSDNLCAPFEDIKLPMYVIAGKYCPTSRDVYLSYIEKKKPMKTLPMIEGSLYHEFYPALVEETKRYIYSVDLSRCDVQSHLMRKAPKFVEPFVRQKDYVKKGLAQGVLHEKDITRIAKNILKFWRYETSLIAANVNMLLSRFQSINKDTLCSKSLPFIVEDKVDGGKLGLSEQLSIDAVRTDKTAVVVDMKTGLKMDFHRLTTVGYALVLELETGKPVDIGCILYPKFIERTVPVFNSDVHVTMESLRRWFIEERNSKTAMIAEGLEPKVAENCPDSCGFLQYCRGGK
jgi:CRISPR-associated protein Csa1